MAGFDADDLKNAFANLRAAEMEMAAALNRNFPVGSKVKWIEKTARNPTGPKSGTVYKPATWLNCQMVTVKNAGGFSRYLEFGEIISAEKPA